MTQPPPPGLPAHPAPAATDLGQVAFVIAIVTAAVGIAQQLVGVFIPYLLQNATLYEIQIAFGAVGVVHLALSIGTLVIGVLAARRSRSQLKAGIAIGVGALGVIAGIVGLALVP